MAGVKEVKEKKKQRKKIKRDGAGEMLTHKWESMLAVLLRTRQAHGEGWSEQAKRSWSSKQ